MHRTALTCLIALLAALLACAGSEEPPPEYAGSDTNDLSGSAHCPWSCTESSYCACTRRSPELAACEAPARQSCAIRYNCCRLVLGTEQGNDPSIKDYCDCANLDEAYCQQRYIREVCARSPSRVCGRVAECPVRRVQ